MELKDITKEAVCIAEYSTLGEALELMQTAHTNSLLVTGEDGELVGEVDVTDLLDGIVPISYDGDIATDVLKDEAAFAQAVRNAREKPVSDFMSMDFESVYPTSSIIEVAATAIAHGKARIPVVDHDNRPIGLISRQGLKHILGKFMRRN